MKRFLNSDLNSVVRDGFSKMEVVFIIGDETEPIFYIVLFNSICFRLKHFKCRLDVRGTAYEAS